MELSILKCAVTSYGYTLVTWNLAFRCILLTPNNTFWCVNYNKIAVSKPKRQSEGKRAESNHSGDAAIASLTPQLRSQTPVPGSPGSLWPGRSPSCPHPWVPHLTFQQLRTCPRAVRPLPASQTCSSLSPLTRPPFPSASRFQLIFQTLFGFLFSSSVKPFPPCPSSTSACDLGLCTPLAFTSPARTAHSTRVLWDEPGCLL